MLLDYVTESSEEDDMQQGAGHGGHRVGAGRKPKYGDKTVVMRVPRNQVESIQRLLTGEEGRGLGEVRATLERCHAF